MEYLGKLIREYFLFMSALELLCHVIGVDSQKLTKEETLLLEAELFYQLCDALKEILNMQFKDYFQLFKFNSEMEDAVIEANFMRCIINDILSSETYTLSGIAFYTQTPEDIIYELAAGSNTSPSFYLSRKIIELHRSVRPELYRDILKKITCKQAEKGLA
jgi:hypothetical protein